jgi:hypothetical protein
MELFFPCENDRVVKMVQLFTSNQIQSQLTIFLTNLLNAKGLFTTKKAINANQNKR